MPIFEEKPDFFLQERDTTPKVIIFSDLETWHLNPHARAAHAVFEFINAAGANDVEKVKQGVNANLALTTTCNNGYTLMTWAARKGAIDVVKYFLSLGFNPAFSAETNSNIAINTLHAACMSRNVELVHYLLRSYRGLLAVNKIEPGSGRTPLQISLLNGSVTIADALIAQYEASLNNADVQGRTALLHSLGIFIRKEFDNDKHNPEYLEQLSKVACLLLNSENAFKPCKSNVLPAISVLFDCNLAFQLKPGQTLQNTISASDLILTMMLLCPKIAIQLKSQADEIKKSADFDPSMPQFKMVHEFITYYEDAMKMAGVQASIARSNEPVPQ